MNDPIPPCPVTIDGRPATVRPTSTADTVADLARALGADPTAGLGVDGVWVQATETLVSAGLRCGATLVTSPPPGATVADPSTVHPSSAITGRPTVARVTAVAGPAAAGTWMLESGRHRVGRSPHCAIHLDDPAVELHHGVLEIADDGRPTFRQLTGRVPVRVDERVETASEVPVAEMLLGTSRLRIDRPGVDRPARATTGGGRGAGPDGSVVVVDGDPWRRTVNRSPASAPAPPPPRIAVPQPPQEHHSPPLLGLVGAGVAAGGAALLAAVIGQPLFALFGAVGALASLATWAVGAATARRARRRSAFEHAAAIEGFRAELAAGHAGAELDHRREHPPLAAVLDHLDGERRLWERRVGPDRPLRATLGLGTVHAPTPIDDRDRLAADLLIAVEHAERLDDVAVPVELCAGELLALYGELDLATAVARAVIVQLAVLSGPADWRIVVVSDRPDEWAWIDWIPHTIVGTGSTHGIDAALDDIAVGDRQLVVITDVPAALSVRTGSLRRLIETTGAAGIVVTPTTHTVPTVCSAVLELGAHGLGRWRHRPELGDSPIHVSGLGRAAAEAAARRLAPLLDPEDVDSAASAAPTSLDLGDVLGAVDAATIADTWRDGGSDPAPVATIGRSGDGAVAVDLVRDGPHALIAGTTGAGKSELLRTLVVALAAQVGPDHLTFVLVDFKGGATFDVCARLPHCVGVVTDLDEGLAERAIVSLDAEVRRRERLLRDVRADDLAGYRRNATEPLPRLVVVVDEFATLAKELPDVLTALIGIAQRGRSLGIHLVLATQRPAGIVTDDIRANTNLRLALRVHDRSDATDVVGDELPATIPRSMPGRAVMRLGPAELVVFQTASCTGARRPRHQQLAVEWPTAPSAAQGAPTELEFVVDAIGDAALLAGVDQPRRPWLDPLPGRLERADLDDALGRCDTTVGMLDDPAGQARRPLQWRRDAGGLLIVGSLGSGTTATAMAAVASRLRTRAPGDLHLYVIDGRGEPALDAFVSVAHCGAVVRATEAERLYRLLRRLVAELDRRTISGDQRPEVVVLIDGIESVRTLLADVDRTDSAAMLERVLQDGPSSSIVTSATTDGSSPTVLATITGERWVHHVEDHGIARAAGLRSATPARIPGRLTVVESGLAAQVVAPGELLAGLADRSERTGPPAVGELPSIVDPDDLADCGDGVVVGLTAEELAVACLRVPAGDHVFVGGAAGTGKTTALRQLASAWAERNPTGRVLAIERRDMVDRSLLDEASRPTLVVVDDAERVGDHDGVLAAIVAGGRPEVMVVAAARIDAVRAAYGHWVREVARSRCGLILTGPGDVDGELLGATLPRRSIIPARPGLAWMIDPTGHRLVQVAARMPG